MTDPRNATPPDEAALEARLQRSLGITAVRAAERVPDRVMERGLAAQTAAGFRYWFRSPRQTWLSMRLLALLMAAIIFLGWPIGSYWAHAENNGLSMFEAWKSYDIRLSMTRDLVILGIFAPFMTLLIGFVVSRQQEMTIAAAGIAEAAQEFLTPSETAAENAKSVGAVVRGEMDALNSGLDGALTRLASVEAMIRRHVDAIETAGERIETRSTGAMAIVASERARLIDLTEQLNLQADDFAAAIADKAKASIEALHSADDLLLRAQGQLEDRLVKLDAVASQALRSFQALGQALTAAEAGMKQSVGAIETTAAETRKAVDQASKAADAAAESAARNAANVGAAAQLASSEAAKAAKTSIEASAREADRAARAAAEAASREAGRIVEASTGAIDQVRQATEAAAAATGEDAAKALAAAERLEEAARRIAQSSALAAAEVGKASETARLHADGAQAESQRATQHMEERNRALAEARAALEAENVRLEELIGEQRRRADRLADAIATQTERLSRLAETQIREQEAATRLAEAQAALQARATEEARLAGEKRAAEEQRKAAEAAEQARRHAEAEADAAKLRAARIEEARRPPDVLELGAEMRRDKPTNNGQRQRLDELADDIAQRRNGGAKPAAKEPPQKRDKQNVSWKEILDATDGAEPLDLAAHSKPKAAGEDAMKIIGELQSFTVELERRLYGEPPTALRERFDRGDRNVFAARLLRLNEADVKRRLRAETARDKAFDRDVHAFLQGFERLLEDATTSATVDEDLEEYLSSPLGRVYLLIGATVGYFA
jgi:hypothetical protein